MKLRHVLLLIVVAPVVPGALWWLTAENPGKDVESLAMRHADKLPLAYFGKRLFDRDCASCHDNPQMHAPTREALGGFSRESIVIAMEFGKMTPMAAHLGKTEKGLIAIYLAGTAPASAWVADHRCDTPAQDATTPFVTNWGLGPHNQRYVTPGLTTITRGNVGSLELAWSLAFPKVTDMRSQPAIVGDNLYFGDKTGQFYAIDRHTGCVRQHREVLSGVRSAITVAELEGGKTLLVFADSMANIYAVNAATFEVEWQTAAQLYETSVITGSITHYGGQLFVPVSSYEVAVSGSPDHVCCKSHGGVIALAAANGEQQWEWHGTADATLQGHNADGANLYGPSGVSVWSTPTVDAARGLIYIGTGENLSHPVTETSDAIVALDMATGEQAWLFQATVGDAWNAACLNDGANCPEDAGGDFDFGASVIMAQLEDGSDVLLAGQKSGDVFALDPDNGGALLWQRRVSNAAIGPDLHKTTTNGGIHWGMSTSGQRLLVSASDPERIRPEYDPRPGIHSLNLADGEVNWFQGVERGCHIPDENKPLIGLQNMRAGKVIDLATQYACSFYFGLSSALTSTDELVFAGSLDGKLRAYDVSSGELLWQTETARPFTGVNGVEGHGGAIDVSGQVLAGDWFYVQSGYSMFGQLPGNVLLAYRVKDKTAP